MVAVKCQEQNCVTKTLEQLKKRLKWITENKKGRRKSVTWLVCVKSEFDCKAEYLKLGRTTRNFGYCRSKVWLKKQKREHLKQWQFLTIRMIYVYGGTSKKTNQIAGWFALRKTVFFLQFLTFHRPENQFTEKITVRLIPNKYNGDICVICVAATSV